VTLEALLQQLVDPAGEAAITDLAQLSELGPEQTTAFLAVWPEIELRKRRWLITELIDLAEDNVDLNFDAVFTIALGDRDAEVRRDAIRGLWEHEGRELIDTLVGLLEHDADAGVRAEAALALGRYVLQAEFELLRSADEERIEQALHRVIDDASEVSEVRGRALEALGARSAEWVRDLIDEAFSEGDRRLRLSAVHAMGRSADPAWLPTLVTELGDEDAEMRFEAAIAVGSIAEEEAVEHLLPLLNDEDAEVQDAAIGALGQIGGDDAKEALEELAREGDDRIKKAAEDALEELAFAEDPLGLSAAGE
jgi:HEAT repeat protein